jgi:transposase-like protein
LGSVDWTERWRCKSCRKTFNALIGTPLAGPRKVAERCDIALSTAFRWRHRHLKAPRDVQTPVLAGIVEADDHPRRANPGV